MLQWVAVPQGRGPPTGDGRSRIMEEGRVSTSSYTAHSSTRTYAYGSCEARAKTQRRRNSIRIY
jgi:hypothetical protein